LVSSSNLAPPTNIQERDAKVLEIVENSGKLRRELQQKGINHEEFDEKIQAQIAKRKKIEQETRDRLR